MKAKNTVLKASRVLERNYDWDIEGGYKEESVDNLLLEQAEISFKAGEKKVVEWINHNYWTGLGAYNIPLKDWQEFLKSEGIENDRQRANAGTD